MPRKPISFELDFMVKDIFPRFTVKQFDDVSFNIKPKNQGLDYDTTGMTGKIFVGVNNDMFMQTTGITVSSNNINILLDKNMLQKNGRAYAEIELSDDAGTITSSSFIFDIDPKIGEGGQIPGEYEGFVEKYERLISEFKSQVNSCTNNANNLINKTVNNCNSSVNNKLNTVDGLINSKISDFEKRFNRLTSAQQQSAEIIDARQDFKGNVYNSLKERIDATDKILRDSAVSTIETESNFTAVEETSNGYFEDVKLEGRTLVNLSTIRNKTLINTDEGRRINFNPQMFKVGTEYTIAMKVGSVVDGTSTLHIQWVFVDGTQKFNTINSDVSKLMNSDVIYKFKQDEFPSTLKRVYLSINASNPSSCTCEIKNCIVLEGDHTQNPPSYFEGLKSVGQDTDEIVVSSVKGDGNLFNSNSVTERHYLDKSTGKLVSSDNFYASDYINCVKGVKYYHNRGSGTVICFYDKAHNYISFVEHDKHFTPTENGYFKIHCKYDAKHPSDFMVCKGSMLNSYQSYGGDKKSLLCYNPTTQTWEKPVLRQWDSIEKHSDGKYYYHIRSEENSYISGDELLNDCITDLTTSVKKLLQEKVHECTNIDLITYENETNYMVNSGAITPKSTLKVHNNISNVVSLLQKKVSKLEDDITNYMIVQNRLLLESRYIADNVTFTVDVASMCSDYEQLYDEDLYMLLLNNILAGKDNYNRNKMETVIDFYAMAFKINFEQCFELLDLIYYQHNPIVEGEIVDGEEGETIVDVEINK